MERVTTADRSNVTATSLYDDYLCWCEEHEKEPLELPMFWREFAERKTKVLWNVRLVFQQPAVFWALGMIRFSTARALCA
jgi:hypothetical protein